MAKHSSSPHLRPHLSPKRMGLNGRMPNPAAWRHIAQGYNRIATYQRRMLAWHTYDLASFILGTSGQRDIAQMVFQTGVNATKIGAMVGIMPADNASASDPRILLRLDSSHGAEEGERMRYWRINTSVPAPPGQVFWYRTSMDAVPDTLYRARVRLESYSTPIAVTIWEETARLADDENDGVSDPSPFETHGPIYSQDCQKVIEAGTKLWQKNRAQLMCWSAGSVTGVAVDSATWGAGFRNLLDNSITTVSGATPGIICRTQYRDSVARGVPLRMGVYLTRSSGTGTLAIRLVDAASNVLASVSGMGTAPSVMYSADSVFTGATSAGTKYDMQVEVTGTGVWAVRSVGLWLHE